MSKLAFIGLGVMGGPMARHLAAAGHDVTVYNRTAAKAEAWVAANGGASAPTPAEAAMGCDAVFLCVGNDDDVRAVTIGAGVLIWIETTPVSRPVNVAQMIPPLTLTPPPSATPPPAATPKLPPIVREPMPVAADPLPPNPFMRDDPNKSKSASLPPAEPQQTLPQALERVAPMPDPPAQSRTTVQAALDVTPKQTDGIGAYSGEVVAWGFPTRIIVASGAARTAINLFGIVPTGNAGERADDARKMEAFLVREGKSITCQPMLNKQYQCFINRQDLALWAISNGIAKATQNAPPEYLSVRP